MALVSNKIRPIVAMGEDLVKTMKASEFNKLLKQMADAVKKGTPADEFYKTYQVYLIEDRESALASRFSRFVETMQYAWNRTINKFRPIRIERVPFIRGQQLSKKLLEEAQAILSSPDKLIEHAFEMSKIEELPSYGVMTMKELSRQVNEKANTADNFAQFFKEAYRDACYDFGRYMEAKVVQELEQERKRISFKVKIVRPMMEKIVPSTLTKIQEHPVYEHFLNKYLALTPSESTEAVTDFYTNLYKSIVKSQVS
jgi:hypothetical protein